LILGARWNRGRLSDVPWEKENGGEGREYPEKRSVRRD